MSEWLDATVPLILLVILHESLLSVFELVGLDCVLECVMVGLGEQDGWCLGTEPGATGLFVPILLGYRIVFRYQVC